MKNSNIIKLIRISIYSILLLMIMVEVVVKCVDNIKIRTTLFIILCIPFILFIGMLLKKPKYAAPRMVALDFLSIAIFIIPIISWGKDLSNTNRLFNAFKGNNGFVFSYVEGFGAKGYDDIESILEHELEYSKKTQYLGDDDLKEIYRIQVGEKIFVYLKQREVRIDEYEFFEQNDLYYSHGGKGLLYDGVGSSGGYTTEETIRKDIANTMWRGVGSKDVGAPAWGVSTDENIFSMTINDKPVDDVILVNEKDGKKYYFWIITNVEEIKTLEDVKAAEIEMNSLQ